MEVFEMIDSDAFIVKGQVRGDEASYCERSVWCVHWQYCVRQRHKPCRAVVVPIRARAIA